MKWVAYVAVVFSLSVTSPAFAQKVMLEARGGVQGISFSGQPPEESLVPYDGEVLVRIVFDTSVAFSTVGVNTIRSSNNVVTADVVVFDGQGNEITSYPPPTPVLMPQQSETIAYDTGGSGDEFDVTWTLNAVDAANVGYEQVNFYLTPIGCENIFVPETEWPMIYEISPPGVPYYLSLRFSSGTDYEQVNIIVNELHYSDVADDDDADGVANEQDLCPDSLLADYVMFDSGSSGVPNYLDDEGCSIMDHYANCEASTSSSGTRWFSYSGPSQCEIQVGYQLYRDGLIDYTELRLLRNAL